MGLERKQLLAVIVLLLILLVSGYDSYKVIEDREQLLYLEQNPVAKWLMELDGGEMAYLLAAKTIGTGIVAGSVTWMIVKRHTALVPSLVALCLVQAFVVFRYIDGRF